MPDFFGICPLCGAALKKDAKFCVKCGQPVVPQQPAIPPISPSVQHQGPPIIPPVPVPPTNPPAPAIPPASPALANSEQVLCVIGMVNKKTGLFTSILYHMVVTNTRLIFAVQTKEMQKQDASNAREQAKQAGKNVFSQIGAQMASRSGDKYLGMGPSSILVENPQNYSIPLEQLKVIETYSGDFEDNSPDTMIVKTFSDKTTFNIQNATGVNRELKGILGNKVK